MHVHLPLYVEDTFHGGSRNGPYGAAVHAIDWATGVLLDELDALGLADDTIVIFTSDNGRSPVRARAATPRSGAPRRGPPRAACGCPPLSAGQVSCRPE